MRLKVLGLLLLGAVIAKPALAEQVLPMDSMFQEAAQFWGFPAAWTQAIADVESGSNPWSLNIEGKGYRLISKDKSCGHGEACGS